MAVLAAAAGDDGMRMRLLINLGVESLLPAGDGAENLRDAGAGGGGAGAPL